MHPDVIVIGGGIVGLAHTLAAVRRGLRVRLIERTPTPVGASIRNFGMVWPIGQELGEGLDIALRSRSIWLETAEAAGFTARQSGSLHAAYEDDEFAVLGEFVGREGDRPGRDLELLDAASAIGRVPQLNPRGLRGAMWSGTELAVDPREALAALSRWITAMPRVEAVRATAVEAVSGRVTTGDGAVHHAGQIVVCSGADTQTLFPEVFDDPGLTLCKLQMMRTAPQPADWRLGPHLAAGLTLTHYASFRACPTRAKLAARFAETMPDYVANGIHVMATQNALGELVIGDTHHYGDAALQPFDDARLNTLVLDYLRRFLVAPDPRPVATWNGIYPKLTDGRIFLVRQPRPGITVVAGVGGAGMTLSFGLAERTVASIVASASAAARGPAEAATA